MLGRFSRATVSCGPSTSDAVASWYAGALGLKREPRVLGARGEVLDGASSCALAVLELDGFVPSRAPLLQAPFLTFCVSNMRTSARHAARLGGAVLPPDAAAPLPDGEGVFVDPSGRATRVIHRFRRNPLVSLTLRVANVDDAAHFFRAALGLRVLDASEAAEALPRAGARAGAVLAFGAAHNTTALVIERAENEASGTSVDDDCAPVVTAHVSDVLAARREFERAGGAVEGGAKDDFTAICPNGTAWQIVSL